MSSQIDHLLTENRRFSPSPDFAANAIATAALYAEADADREGFWAAQAKALHWHTPFTQVLDWSNPPFAQWFADGELNVAYNCLDRHVEAGNGDRVALLWEGEPGDERRVTYAELTDEVKRVANVLAGLGVVAGDRVAIYLPMIPEAIAAMLAVARLGAIHSVIFGGFSADSLRTRIDDAGAKSSSPPTAATARVASRRSSRPSTRRSPTAAQARRHRRARARRAAHQNEVGWTAGRDIWWHDAVPAAPPSTRRSRSRPRTRCSSSTPPARPASPRASCTPPAAT
jgi:acetyl-CoA synthetase